MPRTSRRVALPRDAHTPVAPVTPATRRERQVIDQSHDRAAQARCPLCRHVLAARLGRGGPFFACGCGAPSLDSSPAIAEDALATADKSVSTNPERKRGDRSTACCDAIPSLALRVRWEPKP